MGLVLEPYDRTMAVPDALEQAGQPIRAAS